MEQALKTKNTEIYWTLNKFCNRQESSLTKTNTQAETAKNK